MLALVWLACAAYAGHYLEQRWVPHDEGALGQSAARVLAGELPHRDFTDIYTGGLAYLDAAVFRLFGMNLVSLRLPLYALFLVTIPAFFWLAGRFLGPWGAAVVTILAVMWSAPNYAAAIPSWYNLLLAVLGTAALARHIQTGHARWLFFSGVCGGVSILVKVVGLYYVAGVLLFLVYRGQCRARSRASDEMMQQRGILYAMLITFGLVLFAAALARLVSPLVEPRELVHFVAPGALIALFLIWREWHTTGPTRGRVVGLLRLTGPFLAGVAIPVALFVAPFVRAGAVTALYQGVFVLPAKRLTFAIERPPALISLVAVVPLGALLAMGRRPRLAWGDFVLSAAILGAVLLLAGRSMPVYRMVWWSVRTLIPVVVAWGALLLVRRDASPAFDAERHQLLMLLLAITALCSLVQFPFSAPVYFCYVAPLLVLTTTAVIATAYPRPLGLMPAIVAIFYVGFALLWTNRGSIYDMDGRFMPHHDTALLALPRGGLHVPPDDSAEYARAVQLIRTHAHGDYVYAAPDAPELSFLTGLRNPTPLLFDFFDDSSSHTDRVLAALDSRQVRVVAINRRPSFSGQLSPRLERELVRRFPDSAVAGRFVVRWRQ